MALIGGYMVSNPSFFNGFEKKFKGMWNVGVMVSVPIWHWGEGFYKVKAAKSEARIARYQLDEAKEKIELQVNQSAFKVNEAAKKLVMAEKNLEKANENLRYANLGFEEGVIPASNVLEAHTAWLSAQSERIDAQIDVKLTEVYLRKATGELAVSYP
jgi:outer membrane protein TolC